MFQLDDNLLQELGLGSLPASEKNKMLAHIYETLELRVGMRLADQMNDEQLDEFEKFIDSNDEAGALKWLETNFPDYKEVVAQELDKLKNEIKAQAPAIVEATMAELAAQGGGTAPPSQPPTASIQPYPQPEAPDGQDLERPEDPAKPA